MRPTVALTSESVADFESTEVSHANSRGIT